MTDISFPPFFRFFVHRPATPEELWNLRHAYTRNVVERVFGVLGKRFRILGDPLPYSVPDQHSIIHACFVLHNIILTHRRGTDDFGAQTNEQYQEEIAQEMAAAQREWERSHPDGVDGAWEFALAGEEPMREVGRDAEGTGASKRSEIMGRMWVDYSRQRFAHEDQKDRAERLAVMKRVRKINARRVIE